MKRHRQATHLVSVQTEHAVLATWLCPVEENFFYFSWVFLFCLLYHSNEETRRDLASEDGAFWLLAVVFLA